MQYEHGGNVHRFIRENEGALTSVIDFSANINPLGLSPVGKANMLNSLEWVSHYPDPDYVKLKSHLSAYYHVSASQLCVFNGAAEGLHELFGYLKPKKAMLPAPSFVEYEKALLIHQTQLEWFYLKCEKKFVLEQDRLLMTLEMERPDLLVICTPNNPTGQVVPAEFLETLVKLLARWQGNLVIDEAFLDFLPEGSDSMSKWLPLYDNLYVLKSFTKFFGVPGLRLGAVLTSNQGFHEHMNCYGVPWRINTMAEYYAIGATTDQDYIARTRAYIETERTLLVEKMSAFEGLVVFDSVADYLLLKLPSEQMAVFENSLRTRGILIRNCQNYRGLTSGYFRVAVKDKESNQRLIEAIGEVLK